MAFLDRLTRLSPKDPRLQNPAWIKAAAVIAKIACFKADSIIETEMVMFGACQPNIYCHIKKTDIPVFCQAMTTVMVAYQDILKAKEEERLKRVKRLRFRLVQ